LKAENTVIRLRWITVSTRDAKRKMIEIANLVSMKAVDTNQRPKSSKAFLTSYFRSIRQTQA